MLPSLESVQNPKIKRVVALLEKPKERRNSRLFVVEGVRELSMALSAGYALQEFYYLPQIVPHPHLHINLPHDFPCQPVSPAVYKKVAYREGTEGVVAVLSPKEFSFADLLLPSKPLVLAMEGVEKPGNIGAMFRTAEAAQVDVILVCNPQCDLYNPNLIRASLGAIFARQVVVCSSEEAVVWLQQKQIHIYVASLQEAKPYHLQDYTQSCAIVVGAEAQGLSKVWREGTSTPVKIPMKGRIDSLNVSVSAGIILFEAIRQRGVSC